jgi:hypothetical protein
MAVELAFVCDGATAVTTGLMAMTTAASKCNHPSRNRMATRRMVLVRSRVENKPHTRHTAARGGCEWAVKEGPDEHAALTW